MNGRMYVGQIENCFALVKSPIETFTEMKEKQAFAGSSGRDKALADLRSPQTIN